MFYFILSIVGLHYQRLDVYIYLTRKFIEIRMFIYLFISLINYKNTNKIIIVFNIRNIFKPNVKNKIKLILKKLT